MRKIIYFILAGLTIAGLASCDKQEFKPSVSDVYSIEIEEDLQTKVSASVPVGEEHTFHATLKKNGTPINCNSFQWDYPTTLFTNVTSGPETNKDGITVGYLKVKGAKMGTGEVSATTSSSNTGGNEITSNKVACNITAGLSSITLSLTGANSVVIGNNSSYKVTATYSDGTTKDVTSEATISSTNEVGLNCSGGVISTSKIDGCLGKRSLTASYGGKSSSSVDFTVTTDFDYLKFELNSDSDVFSDIRDYAINTKYTQYGLQLHSETGARSGYISFRIRNFYLYIKGSTDSYQGNHSYKMNDSSVRDDFQISVTCGETYTLHIYYLGEEVFSQNITIVTN